MKRGYIKKTPANVMPPALRAEVAANPEICAFGTPELQIRFGSCEGRDTNEHAIIVAGKKVQRFWAIIKCCAKHHGVDFHQDAHTEAPKRAREWVALNRASDEDLMEFPKANLIKLRAIRNGEFGKYVPPPVPYKPQVPDVTVTAANVREVFEGAAKKLRSVPRPYDEFEREVRAYARTNGCSEEEARATLALIA